MHLGSANQWQRDCGYEPQGSISLVVGRYAEIHSGCDTLEWLYTELPTGREHGTIVVLFILKESFNVSICLDTSIYQRLSAEIFYLFYYPTDCYDRGIYYAMLGSNSED